MANELFTQAPEEVIRYFDVKGNQPTFDWRDIAPQEHAITFTVAKTTGFDVLSDIRKAVGEAIRNQQSFETFRQGLEPLLRKKGWWGKRVAGDPKGAPVVSQLGSLRRLRTIHWANVATARAAGEWERIQRTKKFMPFLKYLRSTSERRRLEHEFWAGTILPADHEWWSTHYPPNGWQCKCGVRQLTRRQAERDGFDPDADAPPKDERPWLNKRTGERIMVPRGIDPGWQTNPGLYRQRNAANFLGDRLAQLDEARRQIAIADIMGSQVFRQVVRRREKSKMVLPIGPVPQNVIEQSGTTARHVFLSSSSVRHILDEHSERGLKTEDISHAMTLLANPEYVKRQGKGIAVIGNSGGLRWRLVLKVLADEVWLVSFHRRSRNRK